MTTKKKRWSLLFFLFFLTIILSLSLFFYLKLKNNNNSNSTIQNTTPIGNQEITNIEKYIGNTVCKNKYNNWILSSSKDLFEAKNPPYFKQDLNYGGDSFEINHPTLGIYTLTTFAHNIYPARSYSERISVLEETNHLQKNKSLYQYYLDPIKGQIYIIGDNTVVVTKQAETSSAVWGFSISSQKSSNLDSELLKTDEFKCFIRSIILQEN